jgi:hypothetical protein
MVDKPWEEGAIKVIRKAQVPVPIYTLEIVGYFIFFQINSGTFRTAKLPSEVLVRNVAS